MVMVSSGLWFGKYTDLKLSFLCLQFDVVHRLMNICMFLFLDKNSNSLLFFKLLFLNYSEFQQLKRKPSSYSNFFFQFWKSVKEIINFDNKHRCYLYYQKPNRSSIKKVFGASTQKKNLYRKSTGFLRK